MTKEEKIKEAYGEYYDLCKPNEYGWSLSKDFKFFNMFKYHPDYTPSRFRPVELKGIENNNGWIKIESESDLPIKGYYEVISKNSGFPSRASLNKKKGAKMQLILYSHYQPIIKLNNPIY